MENIDVFFKILKNAERKNRRISISTYRNSIDVWANKNEGTGVVAEIVIIKTTETVWGGFLKMKSTEVEKSTIYGRFIDVKTKKYYYFNIPESSEKFDFYLSKIKEYHFNFENKENIKQDKDYKKLLKREL